MSILKKIYIFVFIPFAVIIPQNIDTLSINYRTNKLPFGLEEEAPAERPVVALALSGGGVRGLAQIGVLKAFVENNIPIDVIVGTSMGSIVGGLFAAGYTVEQLDSIAVNTKWNDLLSANSDNRRDLFIDQKVTEDRAILTLRIKGLTPVIPTSINDGQKLSNFLNLLTFQAPIHADSSFDELLYKFRAVCTDLVTGSRVIISKGSLSQAMRASSSVSFLLSPVKMDSLVLVDGGLVANIPVKIASEIGGQYVVAVNTTSSLHPEDALNYPWVIADQIISIPMKLLNESELSSADVVISPDLSKKASNDFSGIDSLINAGYQAALPYVEKIKSDIDSIFQQNLKQEKVYYTNITYNETGSGLFFPLAYGYQNKDSVSNFEIMSDVYSYFDKNNYESIKVKIEESDGGAGFKIEGKYNPAVKEIEIEGITILDSARIREIFLSLKHKPYNAKKIAEKIFKVLRLYRYAGYSLAELSRLNFNKETGILKLNFEEGVISKIIIEGNRYTAPTIISREFSIREGDFFSHNTIQRGLINLRSTNLFEDIVLIVRKDNGNNVLVLKVLEKVSSLIRLGFRIDSEDKAQVSVDIRDENLFGSGTELGLILFGAERNRKLILEHKSNRIFFTYLTYKINAFYEIDDVFSYTNIPTTSTQRFSRGIAGEYRQIYYGASFAAGTQVQRFGNLIFSLKYQVDRVKNLSGNVIQPYEDVIVSLGVNSTVDTQDKYPYPENGFYFKGSYESAQTALGGDIGFTNLLFEYKSHFTLKNNHTLSPRGKIGFADNTLPLSQLYSLGGQNSFFGMREDEFRGRQIFVSSLQYRYKFPFTIFFDTYFKFRYDLGSTWEVQDQIRFKDLRHGIGGSLSFDTPIGPADFSVGRSFLFVKNIPGNPISWGDVQFYFSIGYYY